MNNWHKLAYTIIIVGNAAFAAALAGLDQGRALNDARLWMAVMVAVFSALTMLLPKAGGAEMAGPDDPAVPHG